MKKHMIKFGMIAVLMIATAFSCQKKEETEVKEETVKEEPATVDKDKVKAEIQALENSYADEMNAGNAEGVAVYYADDATSFGQNEAPASGKAAIMALLKKDIAESKGLKAGFTTNEVHVSGDGNQVVEIGAYKVLDASNVAKHTGNYMAVFEKRDGKYVCVRDMSASDMPEDKK